MLLLTMGDCRINVRVQCQSGGRRTSTFALNTISTSIFPWTQTLFKVDLSIGNGPNLKFFDFPLGKPIIGSGSLFLF